LLTNSMNPISRTEGKVPSHEQIEAAAYHLYIERGCRDGHAMDDWLRAEDLLIREIQREAGARALQSGGDGAPSPSPVRREPAKPSKPAARREPARPARLNASSEKITPMPSPASLQPAWRARRAAVAARA
jgi:hypothetical protein